MQRFVNYGNYIIATSVLASAGKPFMASFSISRWIEGRNKELLHTEQLERTFAFSEEARAAATHAAEAYVDALP